MKRILTPTLLTVTVLFGTVACGGDPDRLDESTSAQLTPHVTAARAAAERRDPAAAIAEITAMRRRVTMLFQAGEISDERAADILQRSAAVEAQLAGMAPAPAPSAPPPEPTTTAAPATAAPAPEEVDTGPTDPGGAGKGRGKEKKDRKDD